MQIRQLKFLTCVNVLQVFTLDAQIYDKYFAKKSLHLVTYFSFIYSLCTVPIMKFDFRYSTMKKL